MNFTPPNAIAAAAAGEFCDALLDGLRRTPKQIACKFFYDDAGSRLFEQICTLPEYYPTRTELALLRAHAAEIAELAGPEVEIIEFGAGAGDKIPILLDSFRQPRAYIPVDVSGSSIGRLTKRLAAEYRALQIYPLAVDFAGDISWPTRTSARRLGFFPGSTIGNFEPPDARRFLQRTAVLLSGGALLIGVDLVKDPALLHAAYNDGAGVTAAFNRNLLVRANREAGSNFDVAQFHHYAFYNPAARRIEMHLVSARDQQVLVGAEAVSFSDGETIVTEHSYKYSVGQFQELASSAGMVPRKVWCDPARLFSLHWLDAP